MEPDPSMMAVLTYLRFCFRALVHGLVAGLIAGSGAVASILTVKKAMPADWEWLVIAAATAAAFGNGINSFISSPEAK
jgi:hypothetical protein